MKTVLFFIAFALLAFRSGAQIDPSTPWTWMKGDHNTNNTGTYGTKGIGDPGNKPGARTSAVTWSDKNGNLWLFGGYGYSNSEMGFLNDLWKYEISSNRWTWMKGDSSIQQTAIFGVCGVSNMSNQPGAGYGSISWTDTNGNLWLFGGFGYGEMNYGLLNTIWKYNPLSNEWTWVKGDKSVDNKAVYGIKGNEHINYKPGGRFNSSTWIDKSGNTWIYGGFGYNNSEQGMLNDLWKYNPATNKWSWINGDNTIENKAVYGIKNNSQSSNKPGSRYLSSSWNDADGNFWLFGGYGYDTDDIGNLNDLWKYSVDINKWTWISGDSNTYSMPSYGQKGISQASNKPGGRYNSSGWTDTNGELWLFGGYGTDSTGTLGYLNDFWKFSPFTNSWTWVKGDNTVDNTGVYGIQGHASPENKTGSRLGSVTWSDQTGNLWLFGGYGFDESTSGELNDLWKINSYNVVLPVTLLQFSGTSVNDKINLQWITEQEADFSHFSVQRSFDGYWFSTIGRVEAHGTMSRNEYRFTDAGSAIQKEQKLYYRLQLTDKDGKNSYSKVVFFNQVQTTAQFIVFPNPAVNSVTVSISLRSAGNARFMITDMKGTVVRNTSTALPAGKSSLIMDCSQLSSAMYILTMQTTDGQLLQEKLIIRR